MNILIEILIGTNLIMLFFVQIWIGAYLMGKVLKGV